MSLFDAAVDLDEASRTTYLDENCDDEADLRKEIESLLLAYDSHAVDVRRMFGQLPLGKQSVPETPSEGDPRQTLALSGRQIGHYRILDKVGVGGMGVVYQAYDSRLDRTVALKFLPTHLHADDSAKTRFTQEAKAASALDHVNICTIHDIGETEEGQLYITMPYYPGETISEKLANGPLPAAEAVDYGIQIATGLDKAHSAGIVHRDIKPANVLVTDDDCVKILDFGIAKIGETNLTRTGAALGTVSYMSPEQVKGEEVDQRTDVWAFGVLLYEMLTGKRPFAGDYDQAVIYSVLNAEPDLASITDPDLARITEGCLRKDPKERFQSTAELRNALGGLSQGVGVHLALPRRRVRRRVTIGVSGLIVLIVAIATWFSLKPIDGATGGVHEHQTLVVLPFENVGDPEGQYLADGMSEELSFRLASIKSLGVISRNTSNTYRHAQKSTPEIARELGVDYIVGGTVQWGEDPDGAREIRVMPYLVRTQDDTQIWADAIDRGYKDVLDLQQSVARSIARELAINLKPEEIELLEASLTDNPDAYQEYLKGMAILRRVRGDSSGAVQAIEHFQKALELDSLFVEAAFRTAQVASSLVFIDYWERGRPEPQHWKDVARDAAERTKRLAPGSRADLLANGQYSLGVLRDYAAALRLFTQAEDVAEDADVLQNVAVIYARTGNIEFAYNYLKRALRLDPQNASLWATAASVSRYLRRFDETLEYYEKASSIDTTFRPYCRIAQTELRADLNTERARQTLTEAPRPVPCPEIDFFDRKFSDIVDQYEGSKPNPRAWGYHFYAAESYRALGRRDKELEAWNAAALRNDGLTAIREAGRGDREAALAALDKNRVSLRREKGGLLLINFDKNAAWVYALLGMKDELFLALEADVSGPGWMNRAWLLRPTFDLYRDDPRFKAVMQKYESWETADH